MLLSHKNKGLGVYSFRVISVLRNNFRNLFIFCINVDIHVLLLDENKGQNIILEKAFCFLLLILLNNFKNLFIFCKNADFDKVLLLGKNKGLVIDFIKVISLCNS